MIRELLETASRAGDRVNRLAHSKVVYPSIARLRGEGAMFDRLRELRSLQYLPPEAVARHQAERLAAMLAHAGERAPFYRERWADRPRVTSEDARDYLATLPLLSKTDLQESAHELVVWPPFRRFSRKTTGGSTGQAVTVVKDRRATAYERAAMWLGYGWFGVEVGNRVARFWGAPFATRRRLLTAASDLATNRVRFSAFAFDDAALEEYWKVCLRFGPEYFHGYVSMLEAFADFVQRRGYNGRRLGLRSVIATSEVLTDPQRALIQETFGAPVQIEYGCGEVGPIAYECERGSLHLMAADLAVEVLRDDGTPARAGETGEVVVTDLNNYLMPLVRYRLGDSAVPGASCRCGRGLPVLERLWGRAYDVVQGPDGRRYHGEFFMYLIEDLRREGRRIRQFQVTQDAPDALEVALVADPDPALEHRVREHLRSHMGEVGVAVRWVEAIPRSPSGKMQIIRSRSRPAAQTATTPTGAPVGA